jgi:hypothetical protein
MLRKDRIKQLRQIKKAEINETIVQGFEYLLYLSDFIPNYKQGTVGEYYDSMDETKAENILKDSFYDVKNKNSIRHEHAAIIAAYYYLIKDKNHSCSSTISVIKADGTPDTKSLKEILDQIYPVTFGPYKMIQSLCDNPQCWTIKIEDQSRFILTGQKKKVADFKYICPEDSYWESFKNSVGATTNAALIYMTDLWQKATGTASAAFTSLEDAFNSFEMEGIDLSLPSVSLPTVSSSPSCQGWEPFIQRYGQKGTELMKAFEEYNAEGSCYEFLSCHYKNFLDWYNDKKQEVGRALSINESINLLKEETIACKSGPTQAPITDIEDMGFSKTKEDGYDLDYLLGKNKKFDERYDRSYGKGKCRKDWNQNEIEEYIIELIDGRQPIYYVDEEGNKKQIISGTRTSRLAKRYVRRYFGSLKSIDDNLEAVSKSVLLRLTSQDAAKYGGDRYCKSGESKEDRSKVFFALQDSFKAGSAQDTEDFSYRDTKKTKRQLRRAK